MCDYFADDGGNNCAAPESPPPRVEHHGGAGPFPCGQLGTGGSGQVGLPLITEQGQRPIRHEGGAFPVLNTGVYLVEVAGPLTIGYGCWPDPGRLPQGSPCGGVRLSDHHRNPKGEW